MDIFGEIDSDLFRATSELLAVLGHEAIQRIVSASFLFASGRRSEVDTHIAKILEIMAKMEADRHEEQMALIGKWAGSEEHLRIVLEKFAEHQQENLSAAIAPVGKSSSEVRIGDVEHGGVVVDLSTAQAIRSKGKLKSGDLQTHRVLVDSVTAHNRTIGVYLATNLQSPVKGDLVDPAAEEWPNIYRDSVLQYLEITAKPLVDAAGTIHRLTVIDAKDIAEEDVPQELRDVARKISESRRGAGVWAN